MALSDRKITNYANPVSNLPDHPSQEGWTAEALKAAFDANATGEIKQSINGIVDDLLAIIDGASGADNIGATAITDLDGATVQALLESLRNKLKSIVDSSSGADFIGATAITGLAGATVQALLEALKNYIDTHKESDDHDERYYTETELNATDGIKGSAIIGTSAISGISGTTVKDQLLSLKNLINSVVLGQIPDNTLTNAKLASDVKVGSLATLATEVKTSLVGAINEHEEQINNLTPHLTSQVSQIISVTRDLTLTGIQTILTNANKNIKAIIAMGAVQSSKKWSQGLAISGQQYCNYSAGNTGNYYTGTAVLLFSDTDAVNRSIGTIQSLTKTSFDLNWNITGTGATGTAELRFLILYHE